MKYVSMLSLKEIKDHIGKEVIIISGVSMTRGIVAGVTKSSNIILTDWTEIGFEAIDNGSTKVFPYEAVSDFLLDKDEVKS